MSAAPSLGRTLAALAEPRRALPIALACASLLLAEWLASGDVRALAADAGLLVIFDPVHHTWVRTQWGKDSTCTIRTCSSGA